MRLVTLFVGAGIDLVVAVTLCLCVFGCAQREDPSSSGDGTAVVPFDGGSMDRSAPSFLAPDGAISGDPAHGGDASCTPACQGVSCGAEDGCGGTCVIGSGCCTPSCGGKLCGAGDGCGGTCQAGSGCCAPSCSGKVCGSGDGCEETCQQGSGCSCAASCQGKLCDVSDGCGGMCQAGSGCCTPSCDGKLCGAANGCGGTCLVGSGCCTPSCQGKLCGVSDGCSGTCRAGSGCCTPSCSGKLCGAANGCGGTCQAGSGCCTASCSGKLCGAGDGCGGICPPGSGCCGGLATGYAMLRGTCVASCGGNAGLCHQTDGNVVVYTAGGQARWHTGTYGIADTTALIAQGDGNLVLYGTTCSPACWASGTGGRANNAYWAAIQDDCNLVMYLGAGAPANAIWASSSTCQ
jgi:hypothetical protein